MQRTFRRGRDRGGHEHREAIFLTSVMVYFRVDRDTGRRLNVPPKDNWWLIGAQLGVGVNRTASREWYYDYSVFSLTWTTLGILLKLSLCKFYYFNHPQVVWPIFYVWTIVLGNQINRFPLHIKFKVHRSSIMEFPDWFKLKRKHYKDVTLWVMWHYG